MSRDVIPVASQKLKDENGKLKVCRDASITPMEMNNNVIDTSQKLKVENGKLKVCRDASMM